MCPYFHVVLGQSNGSIKTESIETSCFSNAQIRQSNIRTEWLVTWLFYSKLWWDQVDEVTVWQVYELLDQVYEVAGWQVYEVLGQVDKVNRWQVYELLDQVDEVAGWQVYELLDQVDEVNGWQVCKLLVLFKVALFTLLSITSF